MLLLMVVSAGWAQQQAASSAKPAAGGAQLARGKYIVEEVAKCINCHTPRDSHGAIDRTQLLRGGPVFFQPAQHVSDWPQTCPRIGGNPSATDAEFVTLMTTGIWKFGKPLRDPMPQFHMTKEDAEAVLAYLKSLR
jgi:mono/diheme cytochrome c family protein